LCSGGEIVDFLLQRFNGALRLSFELAMSLFEKLLESRFAFFERLFEAGELLFELFDL